VERDRTVEVEETKRVTIAAGVTKTALWIASGLLAVMLILAAYAFHEGEKGLLGQAFSGTFGFLAGFGYSKIFTRK
jgi:hypothetical protein